MKPPARKLWIVITLFSMALFAVAVGAGVGFHQVEHTALPRINESPGEWRMREAMRLESAGDYSAALDVYEAALPLAFAAEHNRDRVKLRIGTLLSHDGNFEASLPYLQELVRNPSADIHVYEPLCVSLFGLEQWQETRQSAETWLARAKEAGDEMQQGLALLYLGRGNRGLGETAAAGQALRASAELRPGTRADVELARLLHESGKNGEALALTQRYLNSGAADKEGAEARALLERIRNAGAEAQ
ncbi:MAG: hypothetical protein HYV27_13520 [Candidatus Hydrogenedentes bacterium]|nr:hypothetical protein [Candidatus Hydrogenedentota bacterium]